MEIIWENFDITRNTANDVLYVVHVGTVSIRSREIDAEV